MAEDGASQNSDVFWNNQHHITFVYRNPISSIFKIISHCVNAMTNLQLIESNIYRNRERNGLFSNRKMIFINQRTISKISSFFLPHFNSPKIEFDSSSGLYQ